MTTNCPINITPLAQGTNVSLPALQNTNYTAQDFWSFKSRIISNLQANFGTQFSDFVESQLYLMIVENTAFIADLLSFKTDQIANEIFIDTVTEVDNIFRLALLVGFQPTPPIAGASFWIASMNNVLTTDLTFDFVPSIPITVGGQSSTIELFPRDSNNNPLFNDPIVIPAGQTSTTNIIGLEGQTFTQTFTGTGAINQTLTLSNSPVLFGSITVSVDGTTWVLVDAFTDSEQRQEYRVEFDANYDAFVIFGNSRAGLLPSAGSLISIQYRVGGGTIGNITTGSVQVQKQVTVPGLNFSVSVTLTNFTQGQNGYAGDGLNDVRYKLPQYLSTQNRAVSGSDYKILTEQFATAYHGQIGKASAVLRNSGCAGNVIDLYILALSGTSDLALATNELKNDLIAMLANQQMLTDYICVRDGVVLEVDVTIEAIMDHFYVQLQSQYQISVTNQVNAFFALSNWDFNQDLKSADLLKSLSTITQVTSFEINFTTNDPNNSGSLVVTTFYEIIRPGTITISFTYE